MVEALWGLEFESSLGIMAQEWLYWKLADFLGETHNTFMLENIKLRIGDLTPFLRPLVNGVFLPVKSFAVL